MRMKEECLICKAPLEYLKEDMESFIDDLPEEVEEYASGTEQEAYEDDYAEEYEDSYEEEYDEEYDGEYEEDYT